MPLEIRKHKDKHYLVKGDLYYEFTQFANHMRIIGNNRITDKIFHRSNQKLPQARIMWSQLIKDGYVHLKG